VGTTLSAPLGVSLDVTASHKWLVDAAPGSDDTSYEFSARASRSFGALDASYLVLYSPDGYGAIEAFTWNEATLGVNLTSQLNASASYGQNQQRNDVDYEAWNVGATYALTPRMGVDVRYYDTNAVVSPTNAQAFGDEVVATLNFKF
jgi:predicted porin